jgi:hypothetical protein
LAKAWVKLTCRQRETLQIVGYALKENRFDGLYLSRQAQALVCHAELRVVASELFYTYPESAMNCSARSRSSSMYSNSTHHSDSIASGIK